MQYYFNPALTPQLIEEIHLLFKKYNFPNINRFINRNPQEGFKEIIEYYKGEQFMIDNDFSNFLFDNVSRSYTVGQYYYIVRNPHDFYKDGSCWKTINSFGELKRMVSFYTKYGFL